MSFTIAIAGRPNVGKSTLFNRLVGKSMALVDDTAGVTRDWREEDGTLFDLSFRLIDTAGLEDHRPKGSMAARTAARTQMALKKADVILFLVDGKAGLLPDDKSVAREIRKTGRPVLLAVNKCDGYKLPAGFDEAASLGFSDPIALSAAHGDGLDDLYEAIKPFAPEDAVIEEKEEGEEEEIKNLNLAIVGRPNAGKSTLVNQLIGEERVLVGPEPGLTRDSIPVKWNYEGRPIRLIDTAGLRRRARIEEKLERMSAKESLRAIRLAHVVILVLDAGSPFDKQDYTIAQHVIEEGRALIIAVNKWDAADHKVEVTKMIRAKVEASLAQVGEIPVVFISALKGTGIEALMKDAMKIYETWNKRVSTSQLNKWLEAMGEDHPPPIVAGRRVKLRYMTQVKSRPPTFSLFVNKPVELPESYVRFLTNGLRRTFGLQGVPIRWNLRKSSSSNPYDDRKR
jgi:GTP-binding protein